MDSSGSIEGTPDDSAVVDTGWEELDVSLGSEFTATM